MKKFYALAAAAIATVSMNAQLYVVGNGEGLGWDPESPLEVEAKEGSYKFTVNALVELKMSDAKGDWDTFNAGARFANVSPDQVGTPVDLEINGATNFTMPWKGDWTIVVPTDLTTVTLTTTTPQPSGDEAPEVYVRGDMNSWGADPAWKFSAQKNQEGVWAFTFVCSGDTKILAEVGFKIADADWGAYNYGTAAVEFDTEIEWVHNGDNAKLAEDFEGVISFLAPEAAKEPIYVTFSTDTEGVKDVAVETAEGVAEYFNLQGVRVNEPAAGLYLVRKAGKVEKVLVK